MTTWVNTHIELPTGHWVGLLAEGVDLFDEARCGIDRPIELRPVTREEAVYQAYALRQAAKRLEAIAKELR